MNLPTCEQCLGYFTEYKVPQNIFEHCLKVEQVALFLAKQLQESGTGLDTDLIARAALLHDLFKPVTFKDPYHDPYFKLTEEQIAMIVRLQQKYPGKFENEVAYEIFKDEFPELALFLKQSGDSSARERTLPEMIVHYADYRVHDQKIVSLGERFAYFRKAYKAPAQFWENYLAYTQQEEKKLFAQLQFQPEELKEKLEHGR